MFRCPPVKPFRIDVPENSDVDIDAYRAQLYNRNTSKSVYDGSKTVRKFVMITGGRKLEEIEELSQLEILGVKDKWNYGNFYKGSWSNTSVAVNFRGLAEIDNGKLFTERNLLALTQNVRVLKVYATCLDFGRLTANYICEDFNCTLRRLYQSYVSRKEKAKLMIQLTEAISFIHRKGILLRDINPENILILPSGNLVVSYFGGAGQINQFGESPDSNRIGLPEYSASTVLKLNNLSKKYHYSKSTEIFSLGCVLFEMWTNTSYIAIPKELITGSVDSFYLNVFQLGRPFLARNSNGKMHFCERKKFDREKLQDRVYSNISHATPSEDGQSFLQLFQQILLSTDITRVSAENILLSPAYKALNYLINHEEFQGLTSSNNSFPKVHVPEARLTANANNNDSLICMEYDDTQTNNIISNIASFYGFSKIYQRPNH